MFTYLLRRLLGAVPTLFALSVLSFFLINLVPGDPVITMLGEGAAWQEIERVRTEYGFNKPLLVRYVEWLENIITKGSLGRSIIMNNDISSLLLTRFPRTAWLALFSFCIAIGLGVPCGVLAGYNPGGMIDRMVMAGSTLFMAVPIFLVGLFLMWVFAVTLRWFPIAGYISPTENFFAGLRSLFLPSTAISTMYLAYVARMVRAAIVETMTKDFIKTAEAKGVGSRRLIILHILRPSLTPIVTAGGLVLGELLIGTVVSETIFVIPGIGRLMYDAAVKKDFYVLQALLLFAGAVYYIVNVVIDILLLFIDPRLRYD
ncbi:MAG: ABC transporter permease [Candidatus Methanomethyliaceae archaeon]